MTLDEAKDILKTRVGWRNDKTAVGFTLDATNLTTDSGRFFQDEHSAVTLVNIKDCQPIQNISNVDFNAYLTNLRVACVLQVLSDCFEKDFIHDDYLTSIYKNAFDTAISLRMVINVSELLMSSIRSNRTTRFADGFVAKLNYDVFREAPNKFAIRDLNFKYTMGISTRYAYEIASIQRRFGTQRNVLKAITRGQVINDVYLT